MNDEFLAKTASFEEDHAAVIFAFSSSEDGAANYVMLQYPLQTDEQDRRLRLDGLYIELDDQAFGCYHGVASIRRIGDRIEIDLTPEGKRSLHVERLVIVPVHWSSTIDQGLARLAELSRGEYGVQLR
ncbi:hypothetical protein HAV22_02985 [Massilia sp. TW-1]|uniref:Immunity protein 10 of polymorphic toxin system n=1 Tax=Telluria antibiotica TaxID=2717319 RepID=A0ABX0P712_9BURK|nr:Imm10 family immunity protein [Telluria antibiotica]NIA52622.1 hypothetical protein [Telluria antibiotica]